MAEGNVSVGGRYLLLDHLPFTGFLISKCACFALAYLLFPLLILTACWIDGTFTMPVPAKGFRQHYGYWTLFVTTPVVLLLTSYLLRTFVEVIKDIDTYCTNLSDELRLSVENLVNKHIYSLSLRSKAKWILMFTIVAMFF